jgi:hypothetical protein
VKFSDVAEAAIFIQHSVREENNVFIQPSIQKWGLKRLQFATIIIFGPSAAIPTLTYAQMFIYATDFIENCKEF